MRPTVILLLGFFFTTVLHAQTAAVQPLPDMEKDCHPFGSSLIGGRIGDDGRYISLHNIHGVYKYFDAYTLNLVGVINNKDPKWKANDDKYMNYKQREKQPANFSLESARKEPSGSSEFPGYDYIIKDKNGTAVANYEAKAVVRSEFIPTTGTLLIQLSGKDYKTMLLRPGKEAVKIYKKDPVFEYGFIYSPDYRYMVTSNNFIIDLQDAKVVPLQCNDAFCVDVSRIGFRDRSDEFFVSSNDNGIDTYNCTTGLRVSNIPIPAQLPRHRNYAVFAAPNGLDFLYYLNWYTDYALWGIAFWVHDGRFTALCDPYWKIERETQYARIIKEETDRNAKAAAALEGEARRDSITSAELRRNFAIQDEYRRQQSTQAPAPEPAAKPGYINCPVCNGKGTVSQKNIDYYKTTTEYSSGAGSGTINTRVIRTPVYSKYATPTTCSRCNGAGVLRNN